MIRFQSRSIPLMPVLPANRSGEAAADPIFAGLLQFLGVAGAAPAAPVEPVDAHSREEHVAENTLAELLGFGSEPSSSHEAPPDPLRALTPMPAEVNPGAMNQAAAVPPPPVPVQAPARFGRDDTSMETGLKPGAARAAALAFPAAQSPTAPQQSGARQPVQFNAELTDSHQRSVPVAKATGRSTLNPATAGKTELQREQPPATSTPAQNPALDRAQALARVLGAGDAPQMMPREAAPAPAAPPFSRSESAAQPAAASIAAPVVTSDPPPVNPAPVDSGAASAQPARLVAQLTAPIHFAASGAAGSQALTVHLTPPAMGPVEVSVVAAPGTARAVDVVIRVEKRETGTLLQSHLPLLRESLLNQGLDVQGLSLDFSAREQPAERGPANGQGEPSQRDSHETREEAAPPRERLAPVRLALMPLGRRLSLVV